MVQWHEYLHCFPLLAYVLLLTKRECLHHSFPSTMCIFSGRKWSWRTDFLFHCQIHVSSEQTPRTSNKTNNPLLVAFFYQQKCIQWKGGNNESTPATAPCSGENSRPQSTIFEVNLMTHIKNVLNWVPFQPGSHLIHCLIVIWHPPKVLKCL